jgi:hypothetical protein
MTSIRSIPLATALSLALVASAHSQSAVSEASTQAQGTSQTQMKGTQANPTSSARVEGKAEATADARANLESIRKKGSEVSAGARAKTDAKLDAEAKRCNEQANAQGDAKVATRLAAEFGMTAEQLTAEKNELNASWGELMIAHCLMANTKTAITTTQLFELRQEGSGWGQIAAGLGLKLGDTVSAVRAENRVASGQAAADGKVAAIHGPGARVGLGAGVGAGAQAGNIHAGTQVGVGVRIKP